MIPLAEVAAVQAADARAAARGIAVETLMRRAGAAVATATSGVMGGTAGRRVVAIAGKGHNGGDAMVALERLATRGAGVEALVTADPAALEGEVARCAAALRRAGGRVRAYEADTGARSLASADAILDGVLGTGSAGAPRGLAAGAIDAMRRANAPVVAVDIPSGVDGATGEVATVAVRAVVTVTFQALKPGHVLAPGSSCAGRLIVADIGLPLEESGWGMSEAAELAGLVPRPSAAMHKRSRGVLLLIAGSAGMAGAATLAALAAGSSGTGLLVVATPASVTERVGAAVPEALTVALPEDDGALAPGAPAALQRWLGEATGLAVGPGLGRLPATQAVVRTLVEHAPMPTLVDADGLYALGAGEPLAARVAPTLLTPHEGEFARLADGTAAIASGTRLHRALAGALAWNATVLLKGDHTVVAEPNGRVCVNPTGTAVLATGGTGDVLTGLAGSLLAQGLAPFDAARLAAWLHGRAGTLAACSRSPVSVAAPDVASHLPGAFAELMEQAPGPSAGGGG